MTSSPLSALLSGLASELASARATVEALAPLVAEHVRQAPIERRMALLVQAQSLDDLAQRLEALSGLTAAVAEGTPVPAALDAIPLAELADRLRRAAAPGAVAAPAPAASGELVLFD